MQEIAFSTTVTVELDCELPVTASVLWNLLSDPAEISHLLGVHCTFETRLGSRIVLNGNPNPLTDATVCYLDPAHSLGAFWNETIICAKLQDRGPSTRLCIRQIGVHPEAAVQFAAGWRHIFETLSTRLSGQTSVLTHADIVDRYQTQFRSFAQIHGMHHPA